MHAAFRVESNEFKLVRVPLTGNDWGATARKIRALRAHWREAQRFDRFYTLSQASYLSSPEEAARPAPGKASAMHELMRTNFATLCSDVERALKTALGDSCVWETRLWPPGFHIFPASEAHSRQVSRIHVDANSFLVDWNALGFAGKPEATLSFTLRIEAPSPCGIRFWNYSYKKFLKDTGGKTLSEEDYAAVFAGYPHQDVHYETGELILHSGRFFHQILPFPASSAERITLQGNGAWVDGSWRIHW